MCVFLLIYLFNVLLLIVFAHLCSNVQWRPSGEKTVSAVFSPKIKSPAHTENTEYLIQHKSFFSPPCFAYFFQFLLNPYFNFQSINQL